MNDIFTAVVAGVAVWVVIDVVKTQKQIYAARALRDTENTFVGSEQTEMLREQDNDFFDALDGQGETIYGDVL